VSATLTICREGDAWFVEDGLVRVHITKPSGGIIERFVANWDAKGMTPMVITSTAAYEAAKARIHQLTDAKEGSTEAAELAGLGATVKDWEDRQLTGAVSAPGHFETPRRPGQPGGEGESRAGPNPRSRHESGPHHTYEASDPEDAAAEKHVASTASHPDPAEAATRPSGNIRTI
jgi:hypothetical protein